MSKTYLKSDHFNGGGSEAQRGFSCSTGGNDAHAPSGAGEPALCTLCSTSSIKAQRCELYCLMIEQMRRIDIAYRGVL